MHINGKLYYDTTLPNGSSSSCQLFEQFSTALHHIIKTIIPNCGIIHYLDDFMFIANTKELCQEYLNVFMYICKDIGIPLSPSKTTIPATDTVFLGIQLDTIKQAAQLPIEKRKRKSLSKSSIKQYDRYWSDFKRFYRQHSSRSIKYMTCKHVQLFATYLHNYKHISVSSIRCYMSSIAFNAKLRLNIDPTKSFGLKLLMNSYKKCDTHKLIRKPITLIILNRLTEHILSSHSAKHKRIVYALIYSLMYYGCLRISEICHTETPQHILKFGSICLNESEDRIEIQFSSYKHSHTDTPTIAIKCDNSLRCLFLKYLAQRGDLPGPFICHSDMSAYTRNDIVKHLKVNLQDLNYDPTEFNTHSFRIGRATDMAENGASESQIGLMGRWKSLAFKKYIKPSIVISA